jgi:hypothetical protein
MAVTADAFPRDYVGTRDHSRPLFTSLDVVGIIAAIVMALGPLTAYAVGL